MKIKYIKLIILSFLAMGLVSCADSEKSKKPIESTTEISTTETSLPETVPTEKSTSATLTETTSPAESAVLYEEPSEDAPIADISVTLCEILQPVGDYSVAVTGMTDERSFSVANKPMVSASLIKLFVAGAVYENYDAVKSLESYDGETDSLLATMISDSNNTSCNDLVYMLGNNSHADGMAVVNDFCKAHDFTDTEMNRIMLDFNGMENYTSPCDCNDFLLQCCNGTIQGGENIISFMKNQSVRTKIPQGVPEGYGVANKTGELDSVENDSAIIYSLSTGEPLYIITVMTGNLTDTSSARHAISEVSSAVFSFMNVSE